MARSAANRSSSADTYIRDQLAGVRTVLANERTLLAYLRTALTLLVAGVTFIQFFEFELVVILGWVFIPLGAVIFAMGLYRFGRVKQWIGELCTPASESGADSTAS